MKSGRRVRGAVEVPVLLCSRSTATGTLEPTARTKNTCCGLWATTIRLLSSCSEMSYCVDV